MESAKKAISSIDKKKMDEIKTMSKPPPMLAAAMSALLLIIGTPEERKDLSWDNVKKALRRPDFTPSILNFDGDKFQMSKVVRK